MLDNLDHYILQSFKKFLTTETPEEIEFLKQRLINDAQRFTWTSGRKCNFNGCNRTDLQPSIVKGWFWPPTGIKIPYNEAETRPTGPWSTTGGDGRPQPDNRELRLTVFLMIMT